MIFIVYKWKYEAVSSVDAQTAGEELDRIYKENGTIEAGKVVDESRPVTAPLHRCFEWDDSVAAEKFREHQARNIINSIVVVDEKLPSEQKRTRAFVNVSHEYHPIGVVIKCKTMMETLLEQAYKDMETFKNKYISLEELSDVFQAIDKAIGERDDN